MKIKILLIMIALLLISALYFFAVPIKTFFAIDVNPNEYGLVQIIAEYVNGSASRIYGEELKADSYYIYTNVSWYRIIQTRKKILEDGRVQGFWYEWQLPKQSMLNSDNHQCEECQP